MARYTYHCKVCGKQIVLVRPMAERDDPQVGCLCGGQIERQPDAPEFTIRGFSAKNGYSS